MTETLQEKAQLFYDATSLKKEPSRVPILSNAWAWKIQDAGYTYKQALYNNKNMQNVIDYHCKNYAIDALYDNGFRNPFTITSMLGSDKLYTIDDVNFRMNYRDDIVLFYDDDYDALIADPLKFFWGTFIPRKCSKLQEKQNGKHYANAVNEMFNFVQSQGKISKIMANYGVLGCTDGDMPSFLANGLEILFSFMRGIKGTSTDLRRRPQKVKEALAAIDSLFGPKTEGYNNIGHNFNFAWDTGMLFIAHTILSSKQFGEFYQPYLKNAADFAVKYDKQINMFVEGNSEHLYEYFAELPKGHFTIITELNDVFKMKKELNNVAICGGMTTDLLGKEGGKQECIDYAKKLVNELGAGGGYIFSQNKMLTFRNDARSENLKAVCEFVKEYK